MDFLHRTTSSKIPRMHEAMLSGVFPVLATPFLPDGSPDARGFEAIARYAVAAGVDGIVYPGVASEYETLTLDERAQLLDVVAHARGSAALIAGGSATDVEITRTVMRQAQSLGAAAVMVLAPRQSTSCDAAIAFYRDIASAGDVPIMLQNAPPPAGSGLSIDTVLGLVAQVPQIAYVKEEAMPSGARISALLRSAPPHVRGVLGGAGGRYITDELARGAVGTMPAVELAELHVALFRAHRAADRDGVRRWFNRMLPLLNMQAVFRMALTKEVLRRRGIIEHAIKRAPGPELGAGDHAELDELLAELGDVLDPPVVRGGPP